MLTHPERFIFRGKGTKKNDEKTKIVQGKTPALLNLHNADQVSNVSAHLFTTLLLCWRRSFVVVDES